MSVNGNGSSAEFTNNSETMAKLIALENRTGYRMQQFNGQRKFWNPKWDKAIPPRGCEVFVGKIPRDLYEDELVPVFEKIGQIYELRLMMDFSGYNRGYAFVCYTCREHAKLAIERLDNFEIRTGLRIGVCKSVDNCRLFVNGIPKDKSQQEIKKAMSEVSEDVSDVIVHAGSGPGEKNRGFAFVEYQTHRAAAMARRKLMPGRITIFGSEVVTDWAEPEIDMNDTLSRIKNVYVRNLKLTTTEYAIYYAFNNIRPGAIERVKKIPDRDYAFVHFLKREDALYAVQMMNGQKIDGQEIQVSLAKPPTNKNDALNSILQTFSIQQKPAVSRASYTPVNSNNSTAVAASVQDRLSSFLLRNPSPNPLLNPLVNNYSMLPPDLQNNVRAQAALAQLNGLQLPPPPLPPTNAQHSFQQLNNAAHHKQQQAAITGQPQLNIHVNGVGSGQQYPSQLSLAAARNALTSPLPFAQAAAVATASSSQDCGCNGIGNPAAAGGISSTNQFSNGISANGSSSEELKPVSTLDHIAKIQCPIVYLDEMSAMLCGGARPVYHLFSENCVGGKTQYVYRVNFMGNTYTPPQRLYCEDVSEAKKIAAKFVVDETDAWIKKQMTAMISGTQNAVLSSASVGFPLNMVSAAARTSSAIIDTKQNFNSSSSLWSPPTTPSTILSSFDDRSSSTKPNGEHQPPISMSNLQGAGDVGAFFSSAQNLKCHAASGGVNTNGGGGGTDAIFNGGASDLDTLLEEIRKSQARSNQNSRSFSSVDHNSGNGSQQQQAANGFTSLYSSSLFKQAGDARPVQGFQLAQASQQQQSGNRSPPSVFDIVGGDFHGLTIDE